MAATRSQSLLKEAMMNETKEFLESRLENLEKTIDDPNVKIGERIHALLLLLRSRKAKEENHEDQSPNDKELVEMEVAIESIETEHGTVKREANASMILANLEDESMPPCQVPVSDSKILRNVEKICCAHKVFAKMSPHKETLGIKKKQKGFKSWRFKFKHRVAPRDSKSGFEVKMKQNPSKEYPYKMLLEGRFEEVLGDPIAELNQLRETNGIAEYHAEFELLRTRVDLTEDELVILFLDGLQPETQVNVKMFQPQTVSQCLLIGRLYEQAHPKKPFTSTTTFAKSYNSTTTSKRLLPQPKDGEVKTNQQLSKLYNKPASPTAREFLSQEERSDKRAKGLCFSCDVKFTPEHDWQHKKTQLYTKEVDAETKEVEDEIEPETAYGDDNELVNIEVTTSTDLLLSKERDSPPEIAIGCELEAGETDTSIDQNQLIQEDTKNQSTDSFHETSLLHHKNSFLKHQVSISHWEFSHRSSIECLDVYDDWPSTIMRTHQSQSNFDLEYAAINAYQVCDLMSLGTKLLTKGRRKTFLKTWRFKFKNRWTQEEPAVIRFLIRRHLYLNFDCEAPELAGRKRNHGLLFRLRSKQKQRKCPKCWMFKFRKKKIDQRLGYDVIDTYLENKKTWAKWRVRKHDNLSWKEDASDKSRSRSSRCIVEVDIKEDDQKQQGDLGHSSLIIAVANQSHLWSVSYQVWHRWKARCLFVGMISTMWAWLFGEEGFDTGKETRRVAHELEGWISYTWRVEIKRRSNG